MWGYIIDGILIAIIIIAAIVGIVKGLIDSVLGLFGTGIALAAGVFGAKYLSSFVNKIFGLDSFILSKLKDGAEGSFTFFGGEFSNVEIAKFCVWLVTVVIIFLIVKLAIFILSKIFESVTENHPKLSGINRVLGMVFGIAKGGIISVAIIAVASVLSDIPGIGSIITDKIEDTKVTAFAYKYVDEFVEDNLTAEKIQEIVDKIASELDDDKKDDDTGSEGTDASEDTGSNTESGTEGSEGSGSEGTESGTTPSTEEEETKTE